MNSFRQTGWFRRQEANGVPEFSIPRSSKACKKDIQGSTRRWEEAGGRKMRLVKTVGDFNSVRRKNRMSQK